MGSTQTDRYMGGVVEWVGDLYGYFFLKNVSTSSFVSSRFKLSFCFKDLDDMQIFMSG